MKQEELARELAREARVPPAVAQDRIDELVHRIVKKLRRGQRQSPGCGNTRSADGPSGPEMTPREQILAIVRRALDRGQTVEIDGLGTFHGTRHGKEPRYELVPQAQPQVFVAYVAEDLALARRLRDGIAAAGCVPWLDKDKLLPGQDWPRAIRRAVEISDAFVACFSPRSIAKRGQFHNELRWALDCARLRPLEATFLVPVRLEPCVVPLQVAEQVQYVDLFPDWDAGMRKVVRAVRRAGRAGRKPSCRLESLTPR